MLLNAMVDDQSYPLEVPDAVLVEASGFFDQMDHDMDQGCQMGRDWIDNPNTVQRCQFAADKLLTALENENQAMVLMMAGYILSRLPGVSAVNIDPTGELSSTDFVMG